MTMTHKSELKKKTQSQEGEDKKRNRKGQQIGEQ
jgi:hypothetical protein